MESSIFRGGYVLVHGRGTMVLAIWGHPREARQLRLSITWGDEIGTDAEDPIADSSLIFATIANLGLFAAQPGEFRLPDLEAAMGWAARTLRERRLDRFIGTVCLDQASARLADAHQLNFCQLLELEFADVVR